MLRDVNATTEAACIIMIRFSCYMGEIEYKIQTKYEKRIYINVKYRRHKYKMRNRDIQDTKYRRGEPPRQLVIFKRYQLSSSTKPTLSELSRYYVTQ